MSTTRPPREVRMPVLDRILAGEAPDAFRNGTAVSIKESIRRDLEMLFNSRPRHHSPPAHLEEIATSPLTYGLPDMRTRSLADPAQREAFRAELERHIRRFEPRLRGLNVELPPVADELERTLLFRISAVILTEAGDDTIVYDTMLDRASRIMTISGGEGTDPAS